MGAVLLRIIEHHALFEVFSGRDKLSESERGRSQRLMGQHKEDYILGMLSQTEKLLG